MPRLILAVEDDPQIAALYRSIFDEYRLVVAESALQATAFIAAETPDLIILDLGLRGSHGIEVVNSLPPSLNVPILVVSARHDAETFARAIGAPVVRKPFDIERLVQAVERITGPLSPQAVREM